MNRGNSLSIFPVLILATVLLASCSGPQNICTVNCNVGGTATVSLTVVADTPPPNPSLLSFKVTLASITLTPTTGTALVFTPASTVIIDLMRLQSDTAFLGFLPSVPAGSYTVQVALANPQLTFLNDTTSTITANGAACLAGQVCTAAFTTTGTVSIGSFMVTATSGGKQGVEFDFNLNNAISLSSGTLSVNFTPASPNPGVLTAFTLPRANANLGANQLSLIEDLTGVVAVNGTTITITSLTRGVFATTSTSATLVEPSPDGTLCPPSTSLANCAVKGQIASVDAFLKSDGTLELKEFEPLVKTEQDLVEGTVVAVNPTQFTMVVTDLTAATSNSLIGALHVGDGFTVNLSTTSINGFFVDTKGLPVQNQFPNIFNNFFGQTSTSAIQPGQVVAVHVIAPFVAATGTTFASATTDTVILRWSRFSATPTSQASPVLNFNGIPGYFKLPSTNLFEVQTFLGTAGGDGVTNIEGVADINSIDDTKRASIRALYLQNTTNSAAPAFFAAKVRQH